MYVCEPLWLSKNYGNPDCICEERLSVIYTEGVNDMCTEETVCCRAFHGRDRCGGTLSSSACKFWVWVRFHLYICVYIHVDISAYAMCEGEAPPQRM